MDREPSPGRPGASGPDDPGWPLRGVTPDWVDEAEWARMCAGRGEEPEPPDLDEEFYADPDHGAPGAVGGAAAGGGRGPGAGCGRRRRRCGRG